MTTKQKKCFTEMKQQKCRGEREDAKKNTQERQKFKTRTELQNYFLPGITTRQRLLFLWPVVRIATLRFAGFHFATHRPVEIPSGFVTSTEILFALQFILLSQNSVGNHSAWSTTCIGWGNVVRRQKLEQNELGIRMLSFSTDLTNLTSLSEW